MSRGPTARLFVALELPEEVCGALADWARGIARARGALAAGASRRGELRTLAAGSLHLTLCFLGSRPVGEIDALSSALAPCADHCCELSLGAPVWLPPRQPRALAVEVRDGNGELERMQRELERSLRELIDWEPQHRRFRAHITVARISGRPPRVRRAGERADADAGRQGEGAVIELVTPALSFTPEALTLYRSSLLPAGAEYEALASSALAPA